MAKRRRSFSSDGGSSGSARGLSSASGKLSFEDYEVAWIAGLPLEMAAGVAMLDEIHPPLPIVPGDGNTYTLGSLSNGLNVAIACFPSGIYGTNNAAIVSRNVQRAFPRIRIALMVGIGGGVPDKAPSLRLGDVVVGERVIQHDFRRALADGNFKRTNVVIGPPPDLLTVVAKLRAGHEVQESNGLGRIVEETMRRNPHMVGYGHPGDYRDILFMSEYQHYPIKSNCDHCDRSRVVPRPPSRYYDPVIHYGVIASGDQLVRDSYLRGRLAHELDAVCVDIGAAGVMDHLPCLVIRGICDYADSHGNSEWQKYAAATAAAYAKSYLAMFAPTTPQTSLRNALVFHDMDHRYLNIKPAHHGTCHWVRDQAVYQSWKDPEHLSRHQGFLWICGRPGTGKSTLMRRMFDEERKLTRDTDTVVSFFFHERGSQLQRSIEGMYRSLLYQILVRYPVLERKLSQSLSDIGIQTLNLGLEQLKSILTELIVQIGPSSRITFFVDAVDDCDESEIRYMIADFLDRGKNVASHGIQLYTCLASRHYSQISLDRGLRMTLERQYGHDQDLLTYVDCKLGAGTGDATHQINREVIEKSDRVFLWVVLVVTILNLEFQRGGTYAVQARLEQIPTQIYDLFDDMLSRDSENMPELRLSIQWLLFAKQPLRYQEYYFAVVAGLDSGAEILQSMDARTITDDQFRHFVLSSSRGLAEVTDDGTVQFIHQSVPDYLVDKKRAHKLWLAPSENFTALGHEQLKKCCFAYMRAAFSRLECYVKLIQISPLEHRDNLVNEANTEFPFIFYTFRHMLRHADIASTAVPQSEFLAALNSRWFKLMDLVATIFKWEPSWSSPGALSNPPTLSYRLASSNVASLLATLPAKDVRLAVRGGPTGYPISVAVASGCRHAVKAILEMEALFSSCANSSPCCYRCGSTQHSLCQPPSYNLLDEDGYTPLGSAVARRQSAIVDLLLAVEDLDVNAKSSQGEMPLITAMRLDQEDIVEKILRSRRIDVNARHGNEAYTPLMEAVRVNSIKTAELLLMIPAVDVNAKTRMGKSALSIACERGAEEIVHLLLQRGNVAVNPMDGRGKTPLLVAAISNHTMIVKMLLECPGINAYIQDNEGHTAYSWGTTYAHSSIVSLFHTFRQGGGD